MLANGIMQGQSLQGLAGSDHVCAWLSRGVATAQTSQAMAWPIFSFEVDVSKR